jgi:hypothetical protein
MPPAYRAACSAMRRYACTPRLYPTPARGVQFTKDGALDRIVYTVRDKDPEGRNEDGLRLKTAGQVWCHGWSARGRPGE